ncbi:hypothetical protein K488DRAFT_45576 [Vararia minispora EC-137]|uniref:Uncharacterized protein n=1 Tax=Vararia minispora EC-137 TaxID=1314806 RepID=A0ACB8QRT8_9AGAM|nr:hypothetical protein K488DRAFT_45576 [Vararia minispora EC-137]
MLHGRSPPVRPNRTTYDVALRGSTLVCRNDLAERVLVAMRASSPSGPRPLAGVVYSPPIRNCGGRTFQELIKRLKTEDFTIPAALSPMKLNQSLIVAYALHLSKTGNVDQVHALLYHLIPELDPSRRRSTEWRELSGEEQRLQKFADKQALIDRAAELGPSVLGTLLLGLRNKGSTSAAERLWTAMKRAERASWATAGPWSIPVEAYTTMIQVYTNEARRVRYKATSLKELSITRLSPNDLPRFGPVRILSERARETVHAAGGRRCIVGRAMGLAVYYDLLRAPKRIIRAFDAIGEERYTNRPKLPRPDARVFYAVLRLVGHHDGMQRRKRFARPSYGRRRLQTSRIRSLRTGAASRWCTRELVNVVESMRARGIGIPVGYQSLLIGRWGSLSEPSRSLNEPVRTPVSNPDPPRQDTAPPFGFRPLKTRGLPIRPCTRRGLVKSDERILERRSWRARRCII